MTFALTHPAPTERRWTETHKGSPALLRLADQHYTRQTPGSSQACRPGVNLVLVLEGGRAAWVVWRPIPQVGRRDGLEAWECTLFRSEEPTRLASDLIREAVDITWRRWGWPPRDGLITGIGVEQTRRRRSRRHEPGHCFRLAGWEPIATRRSSRAGETVWLRAPPPQREVPR